MALLFAALLVLHGLIHLLGTAKAFGWAALPQLTVPIAPVTGAVWLAASVLFLWAAAALFLQPRPAPCSTGSWPWAPCSDS